MDYTYSYWYITNTDNEVIHIKGFSLNNKKRNQIIEIKYQNKITGDKRHHVFLEDKNKTFSFYFQ